MADYRNDPEWQAARAEYVAEYPDDTVDGQLVRTIRAAFRLYEIERQWAAKASAAPGATPCS